jgi:polysaccharide export outer membrane protein
VQRGDVLALDFPFTPEFNTNVTVQPDGYISLKGVGDVQVEGQTLPQLNETLKAKYASVLHDPVITITPQTFVAPFFTAYGEIFKPGKYELHGDTTVTQAIAIAGGFTGPTAKHSHVQLFHHAANNMVEVRTINVKHMLKSGDLAEDIYLQPGDAIFVPKNTLSKVQPYLMVPLTAFRLSYSIPNF